MQGPQGPVAPISAKAPRDQRRVPDFSTDRARRTPEVVLGVTRDDVVLLDTEIEPEVLGLEIGRQSEASFEVGHVKAVGGEAVDLGEELPGESSSLVL